MRRLPYTGTKQDLNIDDWAETEFGQCWWGQTDEQLRDRTMSAQTEMMREEGEFLHWYLIHSVTEDNAQFMSARTGPEACVKVERWKGKGWAQSWEYRRPDPHRGPYFSFNVLLSNGQLINLIARTQADAIAMTGEVWGHGTVLTCELSLRTPPERVRAWVTYGWRKLMSRTRAEIELKLQEKLKGRNEP